MTLVRGGSILAAALALVACGGSVNGGSGGSGGDGGTAGAGGGGGQGGAGGGQGGQGGGQGGQGGGQGGQGGGQGGQGGGGGSLPSCVGGTDVVLAMDRILLGDTNPDGTPNPTQAWKFYGMNIDGLVSTKESTNLCKPAAGGSPAAVYPDGDNGSDNGFGKNVLPMFLGLSSDMSVLTNESITNGEHTYLLSLSNLGQEPCAASSQLFLGANLGQMPAFDGTDVWPIHPSSLSNPADATSAKCAFAYTTITQSTLEAKPPSQFDLVLRFGGFDMVLPIRQARLAMQLDPDQKGATAGQIGGVIATEDLADAVAKVAAAFDESFCDPNSPTLQSILNQIRQASDILSDGSQDPTKECNAVSIGIGFTMKSAKLGPVGSANPPPPDPCP